MASNNNFGYVNNQFTSFSHRNYNDSRSPIVELESAQTVDSMAHETKWQYSGNRDDFYSVSSDTGYERGYSDEEKALVRKIDWMIMPTICILDFLQVQQPTIRALFLSFNQTSFAHSFWINQPSVMLL